MCTPVVVRKGLLKLLSWVGKDMQNLGKWRDGAGFS
jgi:hypothetical protein